MKGRARCGRAWVSLPPQCWDATAKKRLGVLVTHTSGSHVRAVFAHIKDEHATPRRAVASFLRGTLTFSRCGARREGDVIGFPLTRSTRGEPAGRGEAACCP